MQLLKDHTEALRTAIESTGRIMLFQRPVQFETPAAGQATYQPGDTLTLTDADLGDAATCREVARLCAYAPESGQQRARAMLFDNMADLHEHQAALLERQAAADEQHAADAEASRGWATIVRGAQSGKHADDLQQENSALLAELKRQADANESLAARLAALEQAVGGASGQQSITPASGLTDEQVRYCAAIQARIDDGAKPADAIKAERELTADLPANKIVNADLAAWRAAGMPGRAEPRSPDA